MTGEPPRPANGPQTCHSAAPRSGLPTDVSSPVSGRRSCGDTKPGHPAAMAVLPCRASRGFRIAGEVTPRDINAGLGGRCRGAAQDNQTRGVFAAAAPMALRAAALAEVRQIGRPCKHPSRFRWGDGAVVRGGTDNVCARRLKPTTSTVGTGPVPDAVEWRAPVAPVQMATAPDDDG